MRMWTILVLLLGVTSAAHSELRIDPKQRLLEHDTSDISIPIGSNVAGLSFRTIDGVTHRMNQGKTTSFVFLSTSCPLAKRYTQRLNRLQRQFASQDVTIVGVFPNGEDDFDAVVEHAQKMKFEFPVTKDSHGYLASRLGAKMTPQAVVVDSQGTIQYRGAIDDNRYENRVKQRHLQLALQAVTSGQNPITAETKTMGCSIHRASAADLGNVTYTQHVARILQDNCQSCHRPHQVAPFALTNFQEAKTWATEIESYTQSRLMPPWKAAGGFGEFKHVARLADEELELIQRWVSSGTPEGPLEALPPTPEFSDEWSMGQPDFVLEMPEEYTLGAEGEDDYRHFIIPTNFERDMFVQAVDVVPGNRQIVHHVIAYTDTSGDARKLDALDPGPGYTRFGGVGFKAASSIGGWAPGTRPQKLPEGTGFWLPKGADVVLQVHYYRTGVEETDRTKLGIYFSQHPHPVKVTSGVAINNKFTIPPGESRYKVEASWKAEEPYYAISVYPHMHLLGKEMKVTATLPDGTVHPLVWIKDWDFNWQGGYWFKQPLYFPAGTMVNVVSYFDNSTSNPHNPHSPPQPVGWGEKTTDEMCVAFLGCLKASEWQPQKQTKLKALAANE